MATVTVQVEETARERSAVGLIAPLGVTTDRQTFAGLRWPEGWAAEILPEARTGQVAVVLRGRETDRPHLTYRFHDGGAPLPDRVWAQEDTRFTRPSQALQREIEALTAGAANATETLRRIVDHTASRFVYGHPERRFNDDADAVPITCGLTEGSCIDINTYLVSSCLAAGIEAAYFAGYFFPEKRNGVTNDMHCWVVTRADGVQQEWDIAHHIKTGQGRIEPGYNPRPGRRYALSFGRGHRYRVGDRPLELSCFSEPEWLLPDGRTGRTKLTIRLD